MADFKAGDYVVINFSLLATLEFFDRELDMWRAVQNVGGSQNVFSGHISNTNFARVNNEAAPEFEDQRTTDAPRDGVANVGDGDDPQPSGAQRAGVAPVLQPEEREVLEPKTLYLQTNPEASFNASFRPDSGLRTPDGDVLTTFALDVENGDAKGASDDFEIYTGETVEQE